MMKILLACSSGMSTSLLVSKMKDAAREKGIEAEIWAVAQDKAESDMEKADVLLIGPQMRFLFKKISKVADEKGVPVDVIDPISYGRIDGEAVLDKALELIKKKV
ncbi:PTS sugar transporter subunit IIB [Terribacillus saccharophilus]|uniref:PTS sugar transporter subunit IIB n=1 Tax=Terribacillus saccharophilus TaxID=361277 RepID=A0A268AFH4_9BACI|nr:PTS sugar transporter subunit IIB [Terribacillus saccharophilus]PAD22865.1 PTS sugar transporter subunit IIB [Terribacillus saccharophilus]PAF17906.1 PTS sugar transporter subunit IIB [Terribacillus saccharophilus]PAF22820.1 PTS sugar transporter subunit IIB [Terribacillus saccharophilus]PAF37444.1 PTS sugar transporter subunit IIB [Terribacillus saccharophilus]PAF37746.1 PTS sugar transporter subunit IIB [Terribacillus saccharophilus]